MKVARVVHLDNVVRRTHRKSEEVSDDRQIFLWTTAARDENCR